MVKLTIAIPAHNNSKHISEAIKSAQAQTYRKKEILVIDDCSQDNTVQIAKDLGVRVIVNEVNLGIGKNLEKFFDESLGGYLVFLCADDIFTHPEVCNDIVQAFHQDLKIGVVGRYYYFFMDGHKGAIGVCRDKRILISSCCPSGMAFRKDKDLKVYGTNKIFIEMPFITMQYLVKYRWTMIEYDTIASRYAPGVNTGTKKSYYTESPTQNWIDLIGENYQDFPVFITLKNRAPKLLGREIYLHFQNDRSVIFKGKFWAFALMALVIPSFVLKNLSSFYRHRIARRSARIIERKKD